MKFNLFSTFVTPQNSGFPPSTLIGLNSSVIQKLLCWSKIMISLT